MHSVLRTSILACSDASAQEPAQQAGRGPSGWQQAGEAWHPQHSASCPALLAATMPAAASRGTPKAVWRSVASSGQPSLTLKICAGR